MRALMILLEFLVFVPAVSKFIDILYKDKPKTIRNVYLLSVMMLPSLIYIDHGHFQPNQVMHGLVIWAIYHIVRERVHAALVCMVMAVHFKQMALYFVLPFIV
jgi:ALG6, ALG8 glycosyltransferase family